MFTGIIEECGDVMRVAKNGGGIQLDIRARIVARGAIQGQSIAVNGCCLTVTRIKKSGNSCLLGFDLLQETWDRTSFRSLKPGQKVNLERALATNGRLDGHFVTGHIDAPGTIRSIKSIGKDHIVQITLPEAVRPYVIFKGSIAVDGISLTVAKITRNALTVCIIPHTWAVTNLSEKQCGDLVNLEADMLGKYVAQFLERKFLSSRQLKRRGK